MATVKLEYKGKLRTQCIHLQSNTRIITDAPIDNKGKGESFSPTDLLAAALGSCIMTIMGIKAKQRDIDLEGTQLEITKIMSSQPRKVKEVKIVFYFPDKKYTEADKVILERVANICPVALSLHPDLKQSFRFNWVS